MARYIQFMTSDGSPILVEVDEAEVAPQRGVVKAGLKERVQDTAGAAVAMAQAAFEEALERVVRHNAQAFIQSVRSIPAPPSEVEITFGLKVTGEVGNVAICKAGGEANYTVKLSWKQKAKEE